MIRQPVRDEWDDDRIDAELRAALTIDPSPGLHARVRARVAAEPAPASGLSLRWAWMAAGAVVAVTAMTLTLVDRTRGVPDRPVRLDTSADVLTRVRAYPDPVAPAFRGRVETARFAAAPSADQARGAGTAPGTAARFAPGDRAAFALLLRLSRSGQLTPPDSLPLVVEAPDAVPPAIVIPAIEIPTLAVSGVTEGESQ